MVEDLSFETKDFKMCPQGQRYPPPLLGAPPAPGNFCDFAAKKNSNFNAILITFFTF